MAEDCIRCFVVVFFVNIFLSLSTILIFYCVFAHEVGNEKLEVSAPCGLLMCTCSLIAIQQTKFKAGSY